MGSFITHRKENWPVLSGMQLAFRPRRCSSSSRFVLFNVESWNDFSKQTSIAGAKKGRVLRSSAIPKLKLPTSSIPGSVHRKATGRAELILRREMQKSENVYNLLNENESPISQTDIELDSIDLNNNPDFHKQINIREAENDVEIHSQTSTIACQTDDNSVVEVACQTFETVTTNTTTQSVSSQTNAWTQPTLLEMLRFDHQLKVWTGLGADTFDILEMIIEEMENKHDITFTLAAFDRIVLVMMIIRHNFQFNMVCDLFGRSKTTISKYFRSTVVIMSEALHSLVYWPTQEENLASMPTYFVPFFCDTQIVLDCTECKITLMKCVNCRMASYSHYKSAHTVKYLVGVTPCGSINYISRGYPGRASDKYIFNKEKVNELINPNLGAVMTDKGFAIDKELDEKG
jgi:DDE superfamily endonuclease